MNPNPFTLLSPRAAKLPILVSSPHSGTAFPSETAQEIHNTSLHHPGDTDWFVHQLYDFAPDLGITLISAHYSRYVIDLNRNPQNESLYSDGRIESSLVPRKTFKGKEIYRNYPNSAEIERRLELYYWPYYKEIESQLRDLKRNHTHVLFFDAHSIKSHVESIQSAPFPHLIVGDQDGKTAHPKLSQVAIESLKKNETGFDVSSNTPFKGGQLTRFFGNPKSGVHSLQLEMRQDVYMDEAKDLYLENKANQIRPVLENMFHQLAKALEDLR